MKIFILITALFFATFGCMHISDQHISVKLLEEKHLPDYPSASSIELYGNRFYIMGDDAASILSLDRSYNDAKLISVFKTDLKRIPKTEKADLESSAIINYKGEKYLLLCGSGSTLKRESIVLLLMKDQKSIQTFSISSLLKNLRKEIPDINIEGCTAYGDKIILSNRANTTSKTNQLIITDDHFFDSDNHVFNIIPIDLQTDSIIGISSVAYLKEKDLLLFAATIEDTPSSYEDGAIGDSYIGIIKNFSSKEKSASITPDELINLSEKIPQLKQQKIEGLFAEEISAKKFTLHLVSDNDNGESGIFKVEMKF